MKILLDFLWVALLAVIAFLAVLFFFGDEATPHKETPAKTTTDERRFASTPARDVRFREPVRGTTIRNTSNREREGPADGTLCRVCGLVHDEVSFCLVWGT